MKLAACLSALGAVLIASHAALADITPTREARYRPYAEVIQKYGYACHAVLIRQELTFGKEYEAYKRAGGHGYIVKCSNDRFYNIGIDRRGRIAPRKDMVSPAG